MTDDIAAAVERANTLARQAADALPFDAVHPVGAVQWVPVDQVRANDYNPNSVAPHEMRLLHTSITADGYTQPVVVVADPDRGGYVIVDGFHRWSIARRPDTREALHGYLPVVVLDRPVADRMAATIRHNRARGKHSIAGMSHIVFEMLTAGQTDEEVCQKLGLEAEELVRLKHITGYSALYRDHNYGRAYLVSTQIAEKARYAAEHPDADIPTHI